MADKSVFVFGKSRMTAPTGQTTVYTAGDDGTYQSIKPVSPRFVDNGNGTISDMATGLMWVKKVGRIIPGASVRADNQIQVARGSYANSTLYAIGDLAWDVAASKHYVCIVGHTSNGANVAADLVNNPSSWIETVWVHAGEDGLGWNDACPIWNNGIINCEALDYAGYSDWRMPNLKELVSIIDYGRQNPAMNATFFPDPLVGVNFYTSSTALAWATTYAWGVKFYRGYVGDTGVDKSTSSGAAGVWPVRGGI